MKNTLQAYVEVDAYWLKFYAVDFDTKTLDVLRYY